MIKVDGLNLNITNELQELLRANPPRHERKAVISPKRDDKGDLVHKVDNDGEKMYVDAIVNTHPNVYFDANGRYYLYSFRSKVIDFNGKDIEVLVTNPKIKTDPKCNLYAKGLPAVRMVIPGSEFWDNGSESTDQHTELVSKGDPTNKIVKVMTREEVLAIDLSGQGESITDLFARATPAEKAMLVEKLKKEMDEL